MIGWTLSQLGRTREYSNEDLDVYVKRFREKALDCWDPMDEEMLLDVSLHRMAKDYKVFLENRSFSSF